MQQLVKFETPAGVKYIDLDCVSYVKTEVRVHTDHRFHTERFSWIEVGFRGGGNVTLETSHQPKLDELMEAWMEYKNAQLIPVESRGLKP